MPAKPKVFVTLPVDESVLDLLRTRCQIEIYPEETAIPPEELARVCREQEIEGLVTIGARITKEFLQQAAKLRAIALMSVGFDNVDLAACTGRRIPVSNSRGSLEETTADLAFALILAVARRVPEADRYVREGQWTQWRWSTLWGADVYGKTLGIIGLGHIGRLVARRATGFSMRILYDTSQRVDEAVERELGAVRADREQLLRESDFVSLHVPLTPETERMITARELGLMKPSAFLINTARGRVVDEAALAEALKAGRIAGAALDVFEHEPKVHPELLRMPNVVLLPHIGSGTGECRTRMARTAAENLLAALRGERPPNIINPEVFDS
ncbi:MAG: 2-hydroxyacid dehydrogenase [Terriglobia bacterium]